MEIAFCAEYPSENQSKFELLGTLVFCGAILGTYNNLTKALLGIAAIL